MDIIVACLAHPREKDRWLPSLQEAWGSFAQVEMLWDPEGEMWGNESEWRLKLWNQANTAAKKAEAGWILFLDADMLPAKDPTPLLRQLPPDVTQVAFRLYDMWNMSTLEYRTDGYWNAHNTPRVWCVRPLYGNNASYMARYSNRAIHTGHLPSNYPTGGRIICAPREYSLVHLAYARDSSRISKHAQYMEQSHLLTPNEIQHADSILGRPTLARLPFNLEFEVHYEDSSSS